MKRLDFLRALLASGLGIALFRTPANAKAAPVQRYLYSGTVAGLRYYDFEHVLEQLMQPSGSTLPVTPPIDRSATPSSPAQGLPERMYKIQPPNWVSYHEHEATLSLEPHNPHDHRAIEVFWQGHKMGYVPRRDNKILYNLMRDGASLTAKVRVVVDDNHWHPDDETVHSLRIRVYEVLPTVLI